MSPKLSALYRILFASIVETAFYLSIWMSWGKMLFFWGNDFLDSVLGFSTQAKIFSGALKTAFYLSMVISWGKFFFLWKYSIVELFPALSERLLAVAKVNSAGLSKQHSAYELYQEKESIVKNAHYLFIINFRTLLEKIQAFLCVFRKYLRKILDFFGKCIGFFIIRSFSLQGRKLFIESIKCALCLSMEAFWESFFIFSERNIHFITFGHCAKSFMCCLWFFSAGLPKLLPTCLWKQYEEKRFLRER